ncbi:MAG: YraN family protein [Planctomycetia bacterium]|nr:YraN family protein [Planctomycetia bacterium]
MKIFHSIFRKCLARWRRLPELEPLEFPPELYRNVSGTLGARGENIAAWYVENVLGLKILQRNAEIHFPDLNNRVHGELDIIAKDGNMIVFVEVRTRRYISAEYGGAETTILTTKQFHVTHAANLWLRKNHISPLIPVRFDVAAVVLGQNNPTIKYYFNAFHWQEMDAPW